MRQVRGRRLSVIDREETLNLDEIKPVKNKKDRNEGVEDEADNHDHIEDLRVFMAIVGVHVLESLPHVEKQSYISTGFRKESSFFGFLVFYFFLDTVTRSGVLSKDNNHTLPIAFGKAVSCRASRHPWGSVK